MKKKKLAASLLLAGALAAQAGMPALAAYTADNNPYGDQHTTFGVKETKEANITNQVSFQIPLYVTVVAKNSATDGTMGVPTNYIIKNTGNGDTTIGVTKVTAEHLGSSWNVIDNVTGITADNQMKFSIGGLDVAQKLEKEAQTSNYKFATSNLDTKGAKNVMFDVSNCEDADRTKILEAAKTTQFVKTEGGVNKIYPLAKDEENNLKLSAEARAKERTDNKNTVAVFKVVYTVAALDQDGKPITTATPYAGEDATQAGYVGGKVTNGTN